MMGLFSQWLLGITACTLLVVVADTLMPKGAVKQVGKIVCGLLLFVVVVKPLVSLSPENLALIGNTWREEIDTQTKEMENYYNQQIKTIIQKELASYIVDKATESGISCTAVVHCVLEEVYVPFSVEIQGIASEHQIFLSHMIVDDLGVLSENITFKEVEHENMEDSPKDETMERGDRGA